MPAKILIIDDEKAIRDSIVGVLEDEGYLVQTASNDQEGLALIRSQKFDLVFLDIWLQNSHLDGLALLDTMKAEFPMLPVIMISGHGNIKTAVSAIKRGAYDFIEKPFKIDRLIHTLERALEMHHLKQEIDVLRKNSPWGEILGNSLPMKQLRQMVARVAPTNSRVMIIGPSGSGKELVARKIHSLSKRAHKAFVTLNAARMTPDRMEVELFGVEAENGKQKIGVLEQAHGGTLYLDEIADMPLVTQNKIFRVLTSQTFERVGGTNAIQVDVRIISSTAKAIEELIEAGRFREDLYHRLAVVPLPVPPLSQYRDDIPLLVRYFVDEISQREGLKHCSFDQESLDIFMTHDWPGNVRQLRNNVERVLILAAQDGQDGFITADMLPNEFHESLPQLANDGEQIMSLPLREARQSFEKQYIIAQINRFGGNISKTAQFIGMERSALHRKMKLLGL